MSVIEVKFSDNSKEVLAATAEQIQAALEAVGNQAVSHAKQNITRSVPRNVSGTSTGNLKNSINHYVEDKTCYVGTSVEYAIYNEFGTGIYADGGGRQTPWAYQDAKGEWHRTRGMKPIHFLKNAIADHIEEYRQIINKFLKG